MLFTFNKEFTLLMDSLLFYSFSLFCSGMEPPKFYIFYLLFLWFGLTTLAYDSFLLLFKLIFYEISDRTYLYWSVISFIV